MQVLDQPSLFQKLLQQLELHVPHLKHPFLLAALGLDVGHHGVVSILAVVQKPRVAPGRVSVGGASAGPADDPLEVAGTLRRRLQLGQLFGLFGLHLFRLGLFGLFGLAESLHQLFYLLICTLHVGLNLKDLLCLRSLGLQPCLLRPCLRVRSLASRRHACICIAGASGVLLAAVSSHLVRVAALSCDGICLRDAELCLRFSDPTSLKLRLYVCQRTERRTVLGLSDVGSCLTPWSLTRRWTGARAVLRCCDLLQRRPSVLQQLCVGAKELFGQQGHALLNLLFPFGAEGARLLRRLALCDL
mmetsp:Transcript_126389/g.300081  ORF Transcript_126389/g.300081 Transcript_126389/m.300081 type:complete len:302 (-) Transcript_126389:1816-2721(-)